MATRIQLRRDTAAQWTANNPTLATGEAGYETDTGRLKIGNGSSAWNSLSYDQVALGTDTTGNYVATISGTSNQISVSGSGSESATVTLSLPQDINTTSSPTFAGATIDAIRVGITGSNEIDTTSGNLIIDSAGGTVTVDDNLVVSGNLTVSGTTTTVNTEEINLADNIIVLNANATGTPTENAGIEVERGDSANVVLRWNESTDTWEATRNGTNYYALVLAGDDIATSDITNFTEDVQDVVGEMVSSNTESGISVTYDDTNGKLNFDVADPTLTFTGDATGSGTITNLGNTSIELTVANNSHDHTASNISDFTESVQDVVGGMVSTNTESGISVTYDDANGKLDFNVNDPTISLTGDVTGSATMTDLGNVSIATTIAANSIALGTDTTGNYVATIAGTANQITVTGSGSETAAVTLSTPQDIHAAANPTFAGATLDSVQVGITAAGEIDTTAGNLTLDSAGGTVLVDDNLSVTGNLTVNGTTTTVNSTVVTIDDPILTLGGDTAPTTDDNKDRGIEFRYYDTQARLGFMGYDDSAGQFIFLTAATNTNEVFSGTKATIDANISGSNINAGTVSATYVDAAIARLASPTFTGTPAAPTAAVDTNTTQIATTAYVVGQGYLKSATASSTYAPLASPTFTGTTIIPTLTLTTADTATTASHYFVETASDGVVRPKTLANVRTEIVTTAAVNSAAATTVGTITSGTWAATDVALAHGGTNASLTAVNGGVVYSTDSAFAITSVGTAGQVLTSNGAGAPTWQSASSGGFDAFLLAGM